jgi:predicted ATP-grasp superfamily ATP-dependent carboligase
MPMTAFVTDGDQRSALAVVRSLGRRGVTTIVGEERPVSLSSVSKYCARHVTYPSPYHDREAFERFLLDFTSRHRVDVLLPVTDVAMHSVCARQQELRSLCRLAVPTFAAFDLVTNKATLLEHAQRCDVPIPPSQFIRAEADIEPSLNAAEYPAVVKPVRSRIQAGGGWLPTTVHYAGTRDAARRLFAEHSYLRSAGCLIQRRIVGPGIGVFLLFDHGTLVADFAHRRLREKPPAGGASVLCESIAVPSELRECGKRLLEPLGWHGAAMLEFKQDRQSGRCFLMEVNGRFWGSLQLAIDAGVDFPRLVCELAAGHRPSAPRGYQIGVRSRWFFGDVDHLLLRLLNNARALDLHASAPSRAKALVDFLTCGARDGVAEWSDLRPFIRELGRYVASIGTSAAQRARRRLRIFASPANAGYHPIRQ